MKQDKLPRWLKIAGSGVFAVVTILAVRSRLNAPSHAETIVQSAESSQASAAPQAGVAAPNSTEPPSPSTRSSQDLETSRFLAENSLPPDAWEHFRAKSNAELERVEAEMERRNTELKKRTDGLAEERLRLLTDGKVHDADRLMADQIVPAFEERQRLAAEAVLVARAKIERRLSQAGLNRPGTDQRIQ